MRRERPNEGKTLAQGHVQLRSQDRAKDLAFDPWFVFKTHTHTHTDTHTIT